MLILGSIEVIVPILITKHCFLCSWYLWAFVVLFLLLNLSGITLESLVLSLSAYMLMLLPGWCLSDAQPAGPITTQTHYPFAGGCPGPRVMEKHGRYQQTTVSLCDYQCLSILSPSMMNNVMLGNCRMECIFLVIISTSHCELSLHLWREILK